MHEDLRTEIKEPRMSKITREEIEQWWRLHQHAEKLGYTDHTVARLGLQNLVKRIQGFADFSGKVDATVTFFDLTLDL